MKKTLQDTNEKSNKLGNTEIFKRIWLYLLFFVIDFYALPLFMKDTGSAMVMMLGIMPVICLVTSVLFGGKNGFCYWFPLLAGILFIPSVFIFYNSSAWIYAVSYGVIAFVGMLIGMLFHKK
jgi:hypothetical protein